MGESSLEVLPAGSIIYGIFEVYNVSTPVTGLIQSNFTTYLTTSGTPSSAVITISEVGNGRYIYSFTPDAEGEWYILIVHAVYNPRGWDEEFIVGGGLGGTSSSSWPFVKDYYRNRAHQYRHVEEEEDRKRKKRNNDDDDDFGFMLSILDDV